MAGQVKYHMLDKAGMPLCGSRAQTLGPTTEAADGEINCLKCHMAKTLTEFHSKFGERRKASQEEPAPAVVLRTEQIRNLVPALEKALAQAKEALGIGSEASNGA